MEENREMTELLRQIQKSNRQLVRTNRLLCVFALVTALCCIVMFMTVYHMLPQLTAVVTRMDTVLSNLEQTTEQLASVDLQTMVRDVDTLVVTGQQSLEQTMDKLNTIDFETLNQAIGDLADVIEPLAKFFNTFR